MQYWVDIQVEGLHGVTVRYFSIQVSALGKKSGYRYRFKGVVISIGLKNASRWSHQAEAIESLESEGSGPGENIFRKPTFQGKWKKQEKASQKHKEDQGEFTEAKSVARFEKKGVC